MKLSLLFVGLVACGGRVEPWVNLDLSEPMDAGAVQESPSERAPSHDAAPIADSGPMCNGDQPGPTLTGKPCPIGHAPVCGGGGYFTCEGVGSTGRWAAWPVPDDAGYCVPCP